MLEESIRKMLASEEVPENISKLVQKLNSDLRRSRNVMGESYAKWDRNLMVYRGVRPPDLDDLEADKLNEPEKFVVPLSYAQVQTFVTFGFLLLTQNQNFFEFDPTGDEDFPLRELSEKALARDLRHNQWPSKLYQFLLDLSRMSIAPIKCWWTIDTMNVDVAVPGSLAESPFGSVATAPSIESREFTKFEGNKLLNISPYRFLPDVRLPLTRWKEGQFVADEDQWHISNIKELERKGLAAGTEFVPKMDQKMWKDRGTCRLDAVEKDFMQPSTDPNDYMVAKTEGNVWLRPSEYDLGSEDYPVLFTFSLANDRMISLERQGYLHGEFNYECAQFSPDNEAKLNESLADVISSIQDVITWLVNARVTSVRRSLDSHIIYHPNFIDSANLEAREPMIPVKKHTPLNMMKEAVQQLSITDTTTGNFADANVLKELMQFVTGINENAMGQFAPGRRSATEARAANAGAAGRMKMILACAWGDALGPLGRKMLTNFRQGVSLETYSKVFGKGEEVQALYPLFHPDDPGELIGSEDFFPFDATLTSEKGFIAQSLQELIIAMMSSPDLALALGFDFESAMTELQYLRGITNAKRFFNPALVRPPVSQPVPPGPGGLEEAATEVPVAGPGGPV